MEIGQVAGTTVFHIRWAGVSYVMTVFNRRYLTHGYWGSALQAVDPRHLLHPVPVSYLPAEPMDQDDFRRYHRTQAQGATEPARVNSAEPARPVTSPIETGAPHSSSMPQSVPSDRNALSFPPGFSPELLPFEYPGFGTGTLGLPALMVRGADGTTATHLSYRSHAVVPDYPGPEGLPWVSGLENHNGSPITSLEITLGDDHTGIEVVLHYTPVPDVPVLLRWARITNRGASPVQLETAVSASVDLPRADLDMITLNGSWAREHRTNRRPLSPGVQQVESRGGASSHQHAPFVAIVEPGADERTGRCWGFSLLYSGNHRHTVEVNQHGRARIMTGINPFAFSVHLSPGEVFDTPASTLAYSSSGLNGLSQAHHRFVRNALLPQRWRSVNRPIVLNTWEAFYFDVNENNVLDLAQKGAEIGAEVLVLDDGWFVGRRDDTRALGDWVVDPEKFPQGLAPVVAAVKEAGLEFGIWIEPEMVSPDSELYRSHPDWAIQIPGRKPSLSRNQLVLDLSNPVVVDYLIHTFSELLKSVDIRFVKWDMNRNISEAGSLAVAPEHQGAVLHNYIKGLYRLLHTLTSRFPHILFEGCAGGGGRFDFGMLAYTPQFWTSDQTDAVERLSIQRGTSLLFPPETMGAHVSAVPNHQVGRVTPPETRGLAALMFNFGYEIDLFSESDEDMQIYRGLSRLYRDHRELFRTGRFVRLLPESVGLGMQERTSGSYGVPHPVAGSHRFAWAVIQDGLMQYGTEHEETSGEGGKSSADRAFVVFFQVLAGANSDGGFLPIHGLDESARYIDVRSGSVYDAVFLRERGLWLPPATGDYRSAYWILKKNSQGVNTNGNGSSVFVREQPDPTPKPADNPMAQDV